MYKEGFKWSKNAFGNMLLSEDILILEVKL